MRTTKSTALALFGAALITAMTGCSSGSTTAFAPNKAANQAPLVATSPIPTLLGPPPGGGVIFPPGGHLSSSTSASAGSAPPGKSVVTPSPVAPPPAAPPPLPADQVSQAPRGTTLLPVDVTSVSPDGQQIFVLVDGSGGACGRYVVVVQENNATVRLGLAHYLPPVGMMCQMYLSPSTITVTLQAPLNQRALIDLATSKTITV